MTTSETYDAGTPILARRAGNKTCRWYVLDTRATRRAGGWFAQAHVLYSGRKGRPMLFTEIARVGTFGKDGEVR